MSEIIETLTPYWAGMPDIPKAFLILFLGLLAAKIARILFRLILRIIRFESLCNRLGFSDFLRKGGLHYTPVELASSLFFWAIALFVFMRVARLLNLSVINEVYAGFSRIMPGLIAAILIIFTGWILLGFIVNFTITVAKNAGVFHADIIGRIIRYLGIILVIILAVGQIEIGTGVLGLMLLVLFASLCFGAALAFGLGCKDIAKDAVQRLLDNLREQSRQGKSGDLEG